MPRPAARVVLARTTAIAERRRHATRSESSPTSTRRSGYAGEDRNPEVT